MGENRFEMNMLLVDDYGGIELIRHGGSKCFFCKGMTDRYYIPYAFVNNNETIGLCTECFYNVMNNLPDDIMDEIVKQVKEGKEKKKLIEQLKEGCYYWVFNKRAQEWMIVEMVDGLIWRTGCDEPDDVNIFEKWQEIPGPESENR